MVRPIPAVANPQTLTHLDDENKRFTPSDPEIQPSSGVPDLQSSPTHTREVS
ncbi:MAG: hypothetical protein ACPHF3_04475 [Pseudomonadales bacterium]